MADATYEGRAREFLNHLDRQVDDLDRVCGEFYGWIKREEEQGTSRDYLWAQLGVMSVGKALTSANLKKFQELFPEASHVYSEKDWSI